MSIMSGLGNKVSAGPKTTIAIILVLTIIFTYFGSSFENDADPESFNPDHELIQASDDASNAFGTQSYSLLMIVKPGDNNVLQIEDMKTLIEFEDTLRNDDDVSSAIVPSQNNPTGFASLSGMLVMSYGLLKSRAEMDTMLMGLDQSLSGLYSLLNNTAVSNETKAQALMGNLTIINGTLSTLQNGNNGAIPEFNKTQSLATLDAISFEHSPDPVPTFLGELQGYDVQNAITQTSSLITSIDSTIDSILPYMEVLAGMPLDPVNGTQILMGLDFALPTMEAGAQSLDGSISGIYYGALATLTRDFSESGGSNAKGTIININFNVELDDEQRYTVEKRIHDLAEEQEGDLKYGVLGNELINEEIQNTMDFSQMFLLVLVFVLIVLILFFTFRSGFDTVLTLLALGMAIIWSYGVSILLGIQGSIIATVVPILLVGLGVDYGIHMTMRFREEKGKGSKNPKAISIAIGTVGMALLLATITTSIGFMSNTVSSLSILKDFAIMVTVGIVSSFIIMTTFLPAVKLVASERRDRKKKKKNMETDSKANRVKNNSKKHAVSIVTVGAKAGDRAPWAVLIILMIISGVAGYGASQLSTVFDFREFIPRDTDAYDNYVFLIDEFEFGDQEYGEFYITGNVATPEVLSAMNQTISNTQDDNQIVPGIPARSILSVMQKYANPATSTDFNQSFVEYWTLSDPDGDGVPNSNVKTLFDILYNFDVSNSEVMSVLHRDGDGNYDAALIQVRVTSDNLKKADVLVEELNEDAAPLKALENGALKKVYVIGGPVVINVVVTEMNEGQIRSIIITIAASFIVLTIVFFLLERSFVLGLITIIPVILVILWILGTMIIFGYNLNVMTITIASLTVGMGITYSIHISERFTEDLKYFKTPGEACENTLTHTGMALAGAFLTTAGGFGILYFHKLPPLQQFGVLIALSITYSFLASAYILPTFLILWAKWRNNYRAKRGIEEEVREKQDEEMENAPKEEPGEEEPVDQELKTDELEEHEIEVKVKDEEN
ncbi:MAG: MMPL family transporter [Methanomassiliicoccales archaeon]|nr:MAG: MMPL family transporter [Methanomassiliicoccales archaeon]